MHPRRGTCASTTGTEPTRRGPDEAAAPRHNVIMCIIGVTPGVGASAEKGLPAAVADPVFRASSPGPAVHPPVRAHDDERGNVLRESASDGARRQCRRVDSAADSSSARTGRLRHGCCCVGAARYEHARRERRPNARRFDVSAKVSVPELLGTPRSHLHRGRTRRPAPPAVSTRAAPGAQCARCLGARGRVARRRPDARHARSRQSSSPTRPPALSERVHNGHYLRIAISRHALDSNASVAVPVGRRSPPSTSDTTGRTGARHGPRVAACTADSRSSTGLCAGAVARTPPRPARCPFRPSPAGARFLG